VMGPAVAAYTGTLLADSSIPAWRDAFRELPYLFVSSAACAAAGAGLLADTGEGTAALVRLGIAGAVGDVALTQQLEHRLGPLVAGPYREGKSGRLLKLSRLFTLSAVTSAIAERLTQRRVLRRVAGILFLAGSATTRFGVFYAGVASANDPAATISVQRARIGAQTLGSD
jgi:formate-dependent nitrite reductase membrane component NrfD